MERAFFGVFGLIGVALLLWGLQLTYQGLRSKSWTTTEGVVITSQVASRRSDRMQDTGGSTAKAEIGYRYSVDGQAYRSDRIAYGYFYSSSNADLAVRFFEKYPEGSEVTVYYDPTDPAVSVLEPGLMTSHFVLLAIGAFLILIGFGLPVAAARAR